MTRINLIPPKLLLDKHLLAEHREIRRLNFFYNRWKGNRIPGFRLGEGHVHFFMDKGRWTLRRYIDLYEECIKRGFNVTFWVDNWKNWKDDDFNDWVPTDKDVLVSLERIMAQLPKDMRYYRNKITLDNYKEILWKNGLQF